VASSPLDTESSHEVTTVEESMRHDPSVSPAVIAFDVAAMNGLRSSLVAAGHGFSALPVPVRARADAAVEALGELGADLAPGAAVFALSWTSALEAYGECCALLGAHVGASAVDLTALDAAGAEGLRAPR
jgi:hypothetical protein